MLSFLFTSSVTLIPIAAIAFVILLVIYKLYIKIRSKFNVTVNCWFCNQDARVAYIDANSWTCLRCEQYNGFTKEGDYNRDIHQHISNGPLPFRSMVGDRQSEAYDDLFPPPKPVNGFCNDCNEGQRLKIEKLSQFEPKSESRYDAELKVFKAHLEEQYRLCSSCDRHLGKVLREKKKIVLGAKFLDFIIKGAEAFKQPHFQKIKSAKRRGWKRCLCILICIFTVLDVLCCAHTLPSLTKEHLSVILGENFAGHVYFFLSHVLTIGKVFLNYFVQIFKQPFIEKIILFLKTLFMMILYSMRIKTTNIATLTLPTLYIQLCSFIILALSFIHNIVDGFKLTRFTFILTLWSVFAGGILDRELILYQEMLTIFACFTTIGLVVTDMYDHRHESSEETTSSFHKMYSDDCDTDEDTQETISMLSQNLNCSTHSCSSTRSSSANNRSFTTGYSGKMSGRLTKSPLTSSVMNLNQLNRSQLSSSFRSFNIDDSRPMRSPSSGSLRNFPINKPVFASHFDINLLDRPQSAFVNNNESFTEAPNMEQQQSKNFTDFNSTTNAPTMNLSYSNLPLASSYSLSTNNIYQQQRSNVLSPSRFSSNYLNSNEGQGSWHPGNCFNNKPLTFGQQHPLLLRSNMTPMAEDISRASSRSSGFESQIGADPSTRENSFDLYSPFNETLSTNTQPLSCSAFNSFPQTSVCPQNGSNFALMQPLTINCNQGSLSNHSLLSKRNTHDSFNLRKINDHLPPIQRGALLKKWKETQICS